MRPMSFRPAHKCSGNRKSSSRPASERRLINSETMSVAIIAARIKNNRLLAEAKAASATSRQLIVKSSPSRVTCLRMPKSTEEWIRDQGLRTDTIVTPVAQVSDLRKIVSTNKACWNCKPVSVPRRAAVIPLGRASLPGSSNLPGSRTERAAPPPLFGLAPHGVYPAGADYSVRGALLPHLFTLTLSPGRNLNRGRYFFCGTFRETRFERAPPAVSRHAALWRPDFPPGWQAET